MVVRHKGKSAAEGHALDCCVSCGEIHWAILVRSYLFVADVEVGFLLYDIAFDGLD